MRLAQPPHALLTFTLTLTLATLTAAVPFPRNVLREHGFGYLLEEQCYQYCGTNNEVCCSAEEACHTSAGVPSCTSISPLAERDIVTTWTETKTYTSTLSEWYVPTITAGVGANGADCVPVEGSGQIACGPICCADFQYCAYQGQCVANAGYSTWSEVVTTGVYVTTRYSAPYRPTDGPTPTGSTNTFASATTTPTNTGPPAAGGSTTEGSSLSPGVIAGIVVGTIAGVVLLLLLCFCCIARGLWHAFAALLGGGKKKDKNKKERIEVTEERYSRHGSTATGAARPTHRTWFGGGGGRPAGAGPRKEKKSGNSLGWLFAAIGAITLILGFRRKDKRKSGGSKPARSDWSSSYYSDSYTATSPSSFSSDRRTRRSRHSRASRVSRHSRGTRASTRPSRI